MNEKKQIIKNYNKKLKNLKKHNKLYFADDNPKLSDSEYDKLKIEVLELEKKFQFLKKNQSSTNIIGSPPSNKFRKIKHLIPMLSLRKIWKTF